MREDIIRDVGCNDADRLNLLTLPPVGISGERPFALNPFQPALLLQLAVGLADRLAAYAELVGDFMLRRNLFTCLKPSGFKPGEQFVFNTIYLGIRLLFIIHL